MEEEDEERRRQRRLEEALEVKSLRRIISAYLNYPEAAEEDVKRYETSFRKLSPAHKDLLSHLPSKFQRLRRCISINSYFIFTMLQAFDPPLDMSQDMDICDEPYDKHAHHENLLSGERNACRCHSASTSGRMCYTEADQAYNGEQSNELHKTSIEMDTNKEVETKNSYESKTSSCHADLENRKETDQSCSNDIADSNGNHRACVEIVICRDGRNFRSNSNSRSDKSASTLITQLFRGKMGHLRETIKEPKESDLFYDSWEHFEIRDPEVAKQLAEILEHDRVFEFLAGLNSDFDEVNEGILGKEPSLLFGGKFFVPLVSLLRQVSSSPREWLDPSFQLNVPLVDVDKVRCIIRNVVRDWAAEGQKERDQCYKPILEELDALFPNRSNDSPPACLVPGAGLGRLALEISCLGFISQGNEFSYYMMICSSFILNQTQTAGEWTIYPWIHSNCNSLSDSDQLCPVLIPDIHPASSQLSLTCFESSAGITEGFSMCGGDFVEVYNDPSQIGVWDAVVTCFFIDTAHNIVEYIEIISKILKDGGVWINLGPLLYHFADMYGQENEMSIELSLEDVKKVALYYGFEFEKEKTIETTYTTNPRSMMQGVRQRFIDASGGITFNNSYLYFCLSFRGNGLNNFRTVDDNTEGVGLVGGDRVTMAFDEGE
ncbi:hypothetical protein JRO89_XS12G0186700 [Xanthoceras sorbifolium]|uniref:carnosine N-methyltransferase n=1 Tax=Xanthoceras sorbifolium TaxID=99658 RepID=A0ABQ8HD21_9ROSI|nr:hypothetical protein JRO89_XS12G0186700 [Xanthoceras sorbifolium]